MTHTRPQSRIALALLLTSIPAALAATACGDDGPDAAAVSKIRIEPSEDVDLDEGQSKALFATALNHKDEPLEAEITWSSSDAEVVSVEPNGLVRAEYFGSAIITASAGGKKASLAVVVRELEPAALFIATNPIEIPLEGTLRLEASVRAENGVELKRRPVEWSSSDPSVATIDEDGVARGLLLGHLEVRATLGSFTKRASAGTVYRFVDLAAGASHGCGLTNAGSAYCWGSNAASELGSDGGGTTVPRKVDTEEKWVEIVAGEGTSCARTDEGAVDCWGRASSGPAPSRVDVPALASIVLGDRHGCGLTDAGAAFCWGENDRGQLGRSEGTGGWSTASAVEGDHSFESIFAAGSTTCALDAAGKAWCWGSDAEGQLGRGSKGADASTPVEVQSQQPFYAIALGAGHGCGLSIEGVASCWGANATGELGRPGEDASVQAVSTVARFSLIAAGGANSSAITVDGQAYGWGANADGQVGTGDAGARRETPGLVGGGSLRWSRLVHGRAHGCGLTLDGLTYCWGNNESGQLGTGSEGERSLSPTLGFGQRPAIL